MWGKIDFKDVSFRHSFQKEDLVAATVLRERANVPSNAAVGAKGEAFVGRLVGNHFGAGQSKQGAVVVKVAKD